MNRKRRQYTVVLGSNRYGPCFVIREVGNLKAAGWIAGSWGTSKADAKALEALVNQANEALEKQSEK